MRGSVAALVLSLAVVAACSSDGGVQPPDGGGPDAPIGSDGGGGDANPPPPPYDGSLGTCLGASLLADLGKKSLLVGASMADATAKAAPFDIRYTYISGGLFDGNSPCASCASNCTSGGNSCSNSGGGCGWWGCWQYDQDPPGAYARNFFSTAQGDGEIPMITYYEILQASGVNEGAPEVTQAATDAAFMTRYFADWRFLLQQIGNATVLLHIEPDFWGYAEQTGQDPHSLSAAVATANATDCASEENSIAGMGRCMVSMVRTYAPNARVGLHASAWSTNIDVAMNTTPSFDVAAEAKKTAAFLVACGADIADYIVVEASDRDAGYYQSIGRNSWWDDTNQTLPDFHQDFAWLTALAEAANKPLIDWQLPVGNMSLPNTTNAWKDNRVDYFFGHTQELAATHMVGFAFGAGDGAQTTPETDNGNLIAKTNTYRQSGGQQLCP
jgi:hypothetical protein